MITKKLSDYSKLHGIDVSNEISLYEYGLLVSDDTDKDGDYRILYRVESGDEGYCGFDYSFMSEKDIDEIFNESWFNKLEFLNHVDMYELEFLSMRFVYKLYDMISYHGHQNILGCSYSEPFEIDNEGV